MHNLDPTPGPAGPDKRRRPTTKRRPIYRADTWHVDDGVATDGSGRPPPQPGPPGVQRRVQAGRSSPSTTPARESGEKGAILRREGLYSSLITDWRRQHRQGLLKAAVGRSDGGRGGPSLLGGREAPGRERTAPPQARPGRGDHRGPGKSARALGGDLEERGPRRRHVERDPGRRRRRARRRRHRPPTRPAPPSAAPRATPLPAPPATAARPARTPGPIAPGPRPRPRPTEIVEVLNRERFCDQAPAQVWATLLDEGTYLASVSTMYRLLRAAPPGPRTTRARPAGPRT